MNANEKKVFKAIIKLPVTKIDFSKGYELGDVNVQTIKLEVQKHVKATKDSYPQKYRSVIAKSFSSLKK